VIAMQYPDCAVCNYWLERIETTKARALAGDELAYDAERQMRRELEEHLERSSTGRVCDETNKIEAGMSSLRLHTAQRNVDAGFAGESASTLSPLCGRDEVSRGLGDGLQP